MIGAFVTELGTWHSAPLIVHDGKEVFERLGAIGALQDGQDRRYNAQS